jgi:hypothetical protein
MSFKAFYIHENTYDTPHNSVTRNRPKGFTAYISQSPDPQNVLLQTSFCSRKDQFCKKTGRLEAHKSDVVEINKRLLPTYLVQMSQKINFFTPDSLYDYVWKYVL